MGIWDYISSAGDSLKKSTPDPTSVKSLCRTSYGYVSSAAGKVGNVVQVHGVDKVSGHFRDEESRAELARFASKFAVNAAFYAWHEGLKIVPGGVPAYNILSKTIHGDRMSKDNKEIKALREKMADMEKDLIVCKTLLQQQEAINDIKLKSHRALRHNQNPEDMIRVFMMMEFVGARLLDDLIVPGVRSSKAK